MFFTQMLYSLVFFINFANHKLFIGPACLQILKKVVSENEQ